MLRRDELAGDWATLLARHTRDHGGFGVALSRNGVSLTELLWPNHPSAVAPPWHGPHVRAVALVREAQDSMGIATASRSSRERAGRSEHFDELIAAFTTKEAYVARLAALDSEPRPKPRFKRARGRQPAALGEAPSYADVVWLYGRRLRSTGPLAIEQALAREVAEGAVDYELPGNGRYGSFALPLPGLARGAEDGPREIVLGVILNAAPVVRETDEMRENVLSRVHEAVGLDHELLGGHFAVACPDGDETTWSGAVATIVEDALTSEPGRALSVEAVRAQSGLEGGRDLHKAERNSLAWHLVARVPGPGGALVWGTLLPNDGGTYSDDLVTTLFLKDGSGNVVARLLGTRLLSVTQDLPVATLSAAVDGQFTLPWQEAISARIAALTGKHRPCRCWLVRGGFPSSTE